MLEGSGKIIGFDGLFGKAHGNSAARWENWDNISPDQARNAVAVLDWTRRATEARPGEHPPLPPQPGGIVDSAVQLDSQSSGGPKVNLLTRDQSVLWFFQTREGAKGVLEIPGSENEPSAARIRYKLIQNADSISAAEDLEARLDAASTISGTTDKDNALAGVARDAAQAGEAGIVKAALWRIAGNEERDRAAHESARLLANRGLRKQAIEVAKTISGNETRDRALAELAGPASN